MKSGSVKTESGDVHIHIKGSDLIQYRLTSCLGACGGGSEGGETRKYQNPSREKTVATEILGILVTSNGNKGAYLKPTPVVPLHQPITSPPHPWKRKREKNEEIKVVTCWANHNIDSLVPSRIIKCFALTT